MFHQPPTFDLALFTHVPFRYATSLQVELEVEPEVVEEVTEEVLGVVEEEDGVEKLVSVPREPLSSSSPTDTRVSSLPRARYEHFATVNVLIG